MGKVLTRTQPVLRFQLGGRVAIAVAVAITAAVGIEAFWIVAWHGIGSDNYPLMAVLGLMCATASHFPVELRPQMKGNVAIAVQFAILLLFPAPLAVALVGVSVFLGNLTLGLRKNANGKPKRGFYDGLFNTAQLMVATGIGAMGLYALRPELVASNPLLADVVAVPMAAAAMYFSNTGIVSLMVAFQLRRNPFDLWAYSQRIEAPAEVALYLIGWITALVAAAYTWAPLILVVPTAVIYLSAKRGVLLSSQTIEAVEAMADVVDMRDHYTAEHSKRVAANAALIARAMGLRFDEIAAVRLAARVHDLGKIALPDTILHKDGRLTAEEFAIMARHPRTGYDILAKFPQYVKGRAMVLAHHERIDGKGYPDRLAGDRIPLGAQIIAVADALDAMTSDRPYRAAMPLHQAMTELRMGRGTQWSAVVVDALDRLVNVEERSLTFGAALPIPQSAAG